jgi:hypothetical protein
VLAAVLAAAAAAAPHGPPAPVELEVAAVLPLPEGPAGLLVLREKGTRTLLPLIVPDRSAFGPAAHPGDPGLVGRALAAVGAEVREVEIDVAEETSAGARVRLAQGSRSVEVRARPSESVALAVAAGARIVTSRRLLDAEGFAEEDFEAARLAAEDDGREVRM